MYSSDTSRYDAASWRQSMALAERIVWVEDALDSLRRTAASRAISRVALPLSLRRDEVLAYAQLIQALELEARSYRAYYRSSLEHWLSGHREECYPLDLARLSTLSADHRSALQYALAADAQRLTPLRRFASHKRRQN